MSATQMISFVRDSSIIVIAAIIIICRHSTTVVVTVVVIVVVVVIVTTEHVWKVPQNPTLPDLCGTLQAAGTSAHNSVRMPMTMTITMTTTLTPTPTITGASISTRRCGRRGGRTMRK
jgi:hypothetical protein